MSTISKHFGLKYKEESYIFKELEKVRQETRKDFLRFKQNLVSKAAVDGGPVCGLQAPDPARPGAQGGAAQAGPQKPSGSPRAKGAAAPLQRARPPSPSQAAAPGRTRPFRPQAFYLRSSAFLRPRPPHRPPAIASGAGTSRPVVLRPPPPAHADRVTSRARPGPRSPLPAGSKPAFDSARSHRATQEAAPPAEAGRLGSSIASEESGVEAAGWPQRMWIRRRFLREGSAASTCRTVREGFRERALSGAAREAGLRTPWPSRAMPTTIEEVIASLESEAQLASDQTVRELIQSVLGPNYDLKTEEISSMGKMHWHKASQAQADQGLQVFQQKVLEELPEGVPSVLQIEQEDIFEWGVSEAESLLFKPQETLEVQAADESSKPLEDEAPAGDSKAAKRVSLKVKSSELLQIRGKEVKRTRKSILGLPQQRQKKSSKLPRDQKLPKQKIPPDYSTPTLHDLCATVPARELPIDLRLASRVYHTASKKGHSPLLGLFGTSFSGDPSTDEEQRDRTNPDLN